MSRANAVKGLVLAACLGFAATSASASEGRVAARTRDDESATRISSGLVGVAPRQTVRLNVIALGRGTRVQVRLRIVDGSGRTLARGQARLTDGEPVSVELPRRSALPREGRVEVRGVFELVARPQDPPPCPPLAVTLEIFDDVSGRTELVIPGTVGPVPSGLPEPPVGPYSCPTSWMTDLTPAE